MSRQNTKASFGHPLSDAPLRRCPARISGR
jgi:type I restriction enzyme M protein